MGIITLTPSLQNGKTVRFLPQNLGCEAGMMCAREDRDALGQVPTSAPAKHQQLNPLHRPVLGWRGREGGKAINSSP